MIYSTIYTLMVHYVGLTTLNAPLVPLPFHMPTIAYRLARLNFQIATHINKSFTSPSTFNLS